MYIYTITHKTEDEDFPFMNAYSTWEKALEAAQDFVDDLNREDGTRIIAERKELETFIYELDDGSEVHILKNRLI